MELQVYKMVCCTLGAQEGNHQGLSRLSHYVTLLLLRRAPLHGAQARAGGHLALQALDGHLGLQQWEKQERRGSQRGCAGQAGRQGGA